MPFSTTTTKLPCRMAISTISLGQCLAGHGLEHRLDMACQHGYAGVELFIDDIDFLAQLLPCDATHQAAAVAAAATVSSPLLRPVWLDCSDGDDARDAEPLSLVDLQRLRAAALIRTWCVRRGLHIVCLQPFRNFEGLRCAAARRKRLAQLGVWCRIARVLGTDLMLIPSNFLPATQLVVADGDNSDDTPDAVVDNRLVADLRAAARMVAQEDSSMRICYEALAWGTHVDTWEHSWRLVQKADCSNLGLCLDTFNMAARSYADPTAQSGVRPNGPDALAKSLASLIDVARSTPEFVERLFLVQVADGERMQPPLRPSTGASSTAAYSLLSDSNQPPHMTWSRNGRLFYGEAARGAYLPVRDVLAAILGEVGYRGWVSFELFNRRMADADRSVPAEMARRGAVAWARLVYDLAAAGYKAYGGGGEDVLDDKELGPKTRTASRKNRKNP